MKLTKENKQKIDRMSYEELLKGWRFAPVGDVWFQGETGNYWSKRMEETLPNNHVEISKKIGW